MASLATLTVPLAVRRVIDHGFSSSDGGVINTYFAMLVLVVAVLALSSSLRYYHVVTLGERVIADIRASLFAHLVKLDPAFFDRVKSGDLLSRLSADTTQVKSAFGVSISIALRNLFLLLGAGVMMVITSPKLAGIVMITIPVIVVPLILSGRRVRKRSRDAQDRLADATSYAAEALGAIRTMQAFVMESVTARQFGDASENAYEASRLSVASRARLTGIAIFMVSASVVGVLWYGAQDVLAGTITAGRLSQFILYALFAASSLGQLSEVYGELSQAAGAAERLSEILSAKPGILPPVQPAVLTQKTRGSLRFDSVSFAYPNLGDIKALHDLSFTIQPGEHVALVGPSGAGKSTVLQLLLRFYDPQKGQILLDDTPITALAPSDLRAQMALVPQDPALFGTSILDNIRYGTPQSTLQQVSQAARQASADEFINALPQGYNTIIGERGMTLSGGQRQRLAIARAILKDAPVLLLDEATSALDSQSEQAVQDVLDHLMRNRTSLVIAHRLSTVRAADRILVLDKGRLVEEGTHETLLAKNGLYARLAQMQFVSSLSGDAP